MLRGSLYAHYQALLGYISNSGCSILHPQEGAHFWMHSGVIRGAKVCHLSVCGHFQLHCHPNGYVLMEHGECVLEMNML